MTFIEVDIPIANVVHHDLDLHFHGQPFLNVNFSQTVRASAKVRNTTLYRF